MDEAALRRGAESANARWDNHVAILTGDFLFSKSSELTAELGRRRRPHPGPDLHPRWSRARSSRPSSPAPDDDPLEHYLDVVAGKTGSLIATSARYGARFGGATPEVEEALDGVRRDRRLGLPALRRHPRHRLRLRRVRQDARHRPARGRADAAGADGAAPPTGPEDARLLELLDADLSDDAPPRRGARPAARAPGDGRGPRLRRRPRRRGQGAAHGPPERPRPRRPSRPSPTSSPPAPPDRGTAPRRQSLSRAPRRGSARWR